MPLRGHNKGVPKSKFRKPGAYMEKKFCEISSWSLNSKSESDKEKYKLHSKEWMRRESQALTWKH